MRLNNNNIEGKIYSTLERNQTLFIEETELYLYVITRTLNFTLRTMRNNWNAWLNKVYNDCYDSNIPLHVKVCSQLIGVGANYVRNLP